MPGRIVVGVDGSEGSVVALRWALEEASLRHAELDVVHAWHHPYVSGEVAGMAMAYPIDDAQLVRSAHDVLDRTVTAAGPLPDGVVVERIVAHGGESSILLDAAKDADLLVVGSRGHGGFTALLLGSVSQQCTLHAPCPVVVVPRPDVD